MASAELHIKDSYYFEVPKFMWRSRRESIKDFPHFWVRLDAEFQKWEAGRLHDELEELGVSNLPPLDELIHDWEGWQHAPRHVNFGKPLDVYLEETLAGNQAGFAKWKRSAENTDRGFEEYLRYNDAAQGWFAAKSEDDDWASTWRAVRERAGGETAVKKYVDLSDHSWNRNKVDVYNHHLHGKVLIPQPFGELRNLYQSESGFCVSKFMLVEVAVGLIVVLLFSWLAKRIVSGERPRGRVWNLFESILLFIRDEVARPAIGEHDADRFVPLLWTVFLFILGCNLMGMMPWAGAPTGAFGVTLGLALVTVGTGIVFGSIKFGPLGFWLNQIPSMELPLVIAIVIKPMILAIEILGFFIKHAVLAVRLLANMVAGHLVLLGIMGLAFTLEGAMSESWSITAVVAVVSSTLFSCLELFVAFLQAYIFTFLSALFIGAAIHHH